MPLSLCLLPVGQNTTELFLRRPSSPDLLSEAQYYTVILTDDTNYLILEFLYIVTSHSLQDLYLGTFPVI